MGYPITTHVDENGRVCTKCKIYKSWSEFGLKANGVNGHNSLCKLCWNKKHRLLRKFSNYGLTVEQYEAMYARQNECCAICNEKITLECIHSKNTLVLIMLVTFL